LAKQIDKRTKYWDLCKLLALKVGKGATENSADRYLKCLYSIILEQLDLNGEIVLPKFGKFYIEHVEDKEIIANGGGGEKKYIYIPERDDVKFVPYKELKERTNKKYGVVKTHGNADDIPLKATVAELFQKTHEKRKS
jgi:nucleoid DNA-binding protein